MAQCKDCIHEKVCDALIKSGCPYLDEEVPADAFCVEFRNTADVVPKSEYDAVVSALDNSTQEFLRLHDDYQEATSEVEKLREINSLLTEAGQEWQKRYNNAKAEVVREIIEEIEKLLHPLETPINKYWVLSPNDLAELKKKYVEGEG